MQTTVGGQPALLTLPRGARALFVCAHGAGAGMQHAFLADVATVLAARKIATLRWNFPYMAAGKKLPDRAPVCIAAVRAVCADAAKRWKQLPLFVGGKSMGGRMTSLADAAAPLPSARGIVFLGFPLQPALPSKKLQNRSEHLARTTPPLLFLQGDRDALAPLPALRRALVPLAKRATLHVIADADHGFDVLVRSGRSRADVLGEIADEIGAFVENMVTRRAP